MNIRRIALRNDTHLAWILTAVLMVGKGKEKEEKGKNERKKRKAVAFSAFAFLLFPFYFGLMAVLVAGISPLTCAEERRNMDDPQGEVLYNGIRLPAQWPPKMIGASPMGDKIAALTNAPMPVPWLERQPAVIPIDVGRQLFVDDFLIESTTLKRTFHRATYYEGDPLVRPDKPWERVGRPMAIAFSDGVWYDPLDGLFKMWYWGGFTGDTTGGKLVSAGPTCFATSRDGMRWEKPNLDVEPGTNVVLRGLRNSQVVWLDHEEADPARRFKCFTQMRTEGDSLWHAEMRVSPDGIHWSQPVLRGPALVGDRSTFFYNPFRKVWVYSIRNTWLPRSRSYREHRDPAGLLGPWETGQLHYWVGADHLDQHNPDPQYQHIVPALYTLDAAAYESLMLGLFSIWQGPENDECQRRGIPKRNEVMLGFSRDGFHWHRPDRRPFLGVSSDQTAWNRGNVQSAGRGCLVVGDYLFFYVSGGTAVGGGGDASTGLGIIRRDGFASLDAGAQAGTVTTRPVRFDGKHLFVNVAAAEGELRAEVLDAGNVIAPFSRENCVPVSDDKTLAQVTWRGAGGLSSVAGKTVQFRFYLRGGSLYSFWVSPDESGASRGYVAAGGPGFTGYADTVGSAAYEAAKGVTASLPASSRGEAP